MCTGSGVEVLRISIGLFFRIVSEPLLRKRYIGGRTLVTWAHDIIELVAKKRYLLPPDLSNETHLSVAELFMETWYTGKPLRAEDKDESSIFEFNTKNPLNVPQKRHNSIKKAKSVASSGRSRSSKRIANENCLEQKPQRNASVDSSFISASDASSASGSFSEQGTSNQETSCSAVLYKTPTLHDRCIMPQPLLQSEFSYNLRRLQELWHQLLKSGKSTFWGHVFIYI